MKRFLRHTIRDDHILHDHFDSVAVCKSFIVDPAQIGISDFHRLKVDVEKELASQIAQIAMGDTKLFQLGLNIISTISFAFSDGRKQVGVELKLQPIHVLNVNLGKVSAKLIEWQEHNFAVSYVQFTAYIRGCDSHILKIIERKREERPLNRREMTLD